MRSQKGLGLIELIVTLGVTGVLIYATARGFSMATAALQKADKNTNANSSLSQVSSLIFKVGTLSASPSGSACASTSASLTCTVDFNVPPTGLLTTVRFILSSSNGAPVLVYQFLKGADWVDMITFSGIDKFEVCDEDSMRSTPTTCSMASDAMSAAFSKYAPVGRNRFFRYRLQGISINGSVTLVQASFFARNSATLVSTDPSYQWGTQWE